MNLIKEAKPEEIITWVIVGLIILLFIIIGIYTAYVTKKDNKERNDSKVKREKETNLKSRESIIKELNSFIEEKIKFSKEFEDSDQSVSEVKKETIKWLKDFTSTIKYKNFLKTENSNEIDNLVNNLIKTSFMVWEKKYNKEIKEVLK